MGFDVGEDRKLAGWSQIVRYFSLLSAQSDRVETVELGKTTEGNPLLLAHVSSAQNIRDLDRYRDIQRKLADPENLADSESPRLISEARAVVAITCSIHATEVGGAQMAIELAHKLASSDDPDILSILDNVIVLLVPSLNPDGLIKVKQWYESTLGTHYEGAIPPHLYHKYTGHDNNRDWFMFTQAETRLVVEHIHNAWRPHITYDVHQTRTDGMRMILPPFVDPVGPNVDPVLQSQLTALGTHMASEMTAAGLAGVAVNVVYDSYSPSRSYPHYHGGVRVLSEAASVRIASPVRIATAQLKSDRGERPTTRSWNHPMPWEGGRWSLRDILDYNLVAATACLDSAARNREGWVRNSFAVLQRAVSHTGNPFAFVIPREQHDPGAAAELIDLLRFADVRVYQSEAKIRHEGAVISRGDRIVLTRQRYGAFAQTMLETQRYPDIRHYPGGPPKRPYDATAHSLPLKMGVDAFEVKKPFEATMRLISGSNGDGSSTIEGGGIVSVVPGANDSVKFANRLISDGCPIFRITTAVATESNILPPGTFLADLRDASTDRISAMAKSLTIDVAPVEPTGRMPAAPLRAPRIGIYRSYVPSTEEGWTRFVLDEYGFDYTSLVDSDVHESGLGERFDVIVLPHQTVRQIHRGFSSASYAAEYAGGLGDAGIRSIRDFAEQGGSIVTWDGSARFAIRYMDLPVSNALAGLASSQFFAPGSLLEMYIDAHHPVGYGMPGRAAALFMDGPAFSVGEGDVIAAFAPDAPLLSGLLIGSDNIAGRAAAVSVPYGKGQVIMFGFRPHFRAQARGTYKMLFNSLYASVMDTDEGDVG